MLLLLLVLVLLSLLLLLVLILLVLILLVLILLVLVLLIGLFFLILLVLILLIGLLFLILLVLILLVLILLVLILLVRLLFLLLLFFQLFFHPFEVFPDRLVFQVITQGILPGLLCSLQVLQGGMGIAKIEQSPAPLPAIRGAGGGLKGRFRLFIPARPVLADPQVIGRGESVGILPDGLLESTGGGSVVLLVIGCPGAGFRISQGRGSHQQEDKDRQQKRGAKGLHALPPDAVSATNPAQFPGN